ncbi:hypothetical protein DICPUDRAFT_95711 [Dictyostelium purpureum]|uniref:INTS8 TPR repeats domain-containing protein n=1 Tax=Dictyostelium purpureum TaxID=5786 RepID=F0ZZR3_DICPU|nr:uncharacterized protein DICPUDRAFT_95711 [Dictyostelium purpureum]EGC30571.1 hypothetical protein DICPUDRAFT_95711 [Dictyostelium purpureum]|eukprot:XP_003292912.1 hypothetical protein DICPUDRAFT_95711 [Dictyostelium purpureum]
MNKIFGLTLEKDQLRESGTTLPKDDTEVIFNNGKNLIFIGDIYFEKKYYRESLKYYLLGCAIENAFYSDPTKTALTTSKYFTHLARRLFDCFYFLKSPMQAIVVSQFFGNLNQTCSVSFKIIQDEFYQLDTNYFQYIWEMPLLEILINTFTKQKDIKKVYILTQIISNPNINEFNHPDIRKNYIKNTKNNFLKAISSNYLLS